MSIQHWIAEKTTLRRHQPNASPPELSDEEERQLVLKLISGENQFHIYEPQPGGIYAHVPRHRCPACQLVARLSREDDTNSRLA